MLWVRNRTQQKGTIYHTLLFISISLMFILVMRRLGFVGKLDQLAYQLLSFLSYMIKTV